MKTTVDIDDAILIAAKKRAAELRRPLRSIIEDGLKNQLRPRPPKTRNQKRIKWVTVKGGLPAGVNWADRTAMHEWLKSSS